MKKVDLIEMKSKILNELKKYADANVTFKEKVNEILMENNRCICILGTDLLISFIETKIDKILTSRLSNESKEDFLNLLYMVMETSVKGTTIMAMDTDTYDKNVKEYAEETLKEFDATITEKV
jgi:uncharacterized protein YqhQ